MADAVVMTETCPSGMVSLPVRCGKVREPESRRSSHAHVFEITGFSTREVGRVTRHHILREFQAAAKIEVTHAESDSKHVVLHFVVQSEAIF